MLDLLLPIYNFYPGYARRLVADVPDERLADQPVAGRAMNHAAFILGHLAWANDRAVTMLGKPAEVPAQWTDLFARGVQPLPDRAKYPSKAELLAALDAAHARLAAAVQAASPETLAQPAPERMRDRYPTLRHLFAGLMTGHYAGHLGQLSAWRRAMGWTNVS